MTDFSPLLKAWLAIAAFGVYAALAAIVYVVRLGQLHSSWLITVLSVMAGSVCYAYLTTLVCRSCGTSFTDGAMVVGTRCRVCGKPL